MFINASKYKWLEGHCFLKIIMRSMLANIIQMPTLPFYGHNTLFFLFLFVQSDNVWSFGTDVWALQWCSNLSGTSHHHRPTQCAGLGAAGWDKNQSSLSILFLPEIRQSSTFSYSIEIETEAKHWIVNNHLQNPFHQSYNPCPAAPSLAPS